MMTGEGLPVTVDCAPAAAASAVSRGEGDAPSTLNPTTLTGGLVLESCFFIVPCVRRWGRGAGQGAWSGGSGWVAAAAERVADW